MAITRLKFESFFEIKKNNKDVKDQEIIKIALKEFDVNLTQRDIEEMREKFMKFMYKYIN